MSPRSAADRSIAAWLAVRTLQRDQAQQALAHAGACCRQAAAEAAQARHQMETAAARVGAAWRAGPDAALHGWRLGCVGALVAMAAARADAVAAADSRRQAALAHLRQADRGVRLLEAAQARRQIGWRVQQQRRVQTQADAAALQAWAVARLESAPC